VLEAGRDVVQSLAGVAVTHQVQVLPQHLDDLRGREARREGEGERGRERERERERERDTDGQTES
jgi:hypothetical protein